MVWNINANKIIDPEIAEGLLGHHIEEDAIRCLIDYDCDVYDSQTGKCILKYRKAVVEPKLCKIAWDNCKDLAKAGRGRGAAAGQIDPESVYWRKRKIAKISKKGWAAHYFVIDKSTGVYKLSKMKVQNEVASNPMGYYGATNSLGVDLPCRLSHYSRCNFEEYKNAIPFFQKISDSYQLLLPEHYKHQNDRAILNDLHIPETCFSTITINRNFRTAIHRDAGDFGFGNLTVLEEGHYHGGYFVLVEYGIGIDLRSGDHLCCDVHLLHGNTELYETPEDKQYNDANPSSFNDNLEVGVVGLNNRFTRLSFVCYLREDILKCDKPPDEFVKPDIKKKGINKFFISLENASDRQKQFINSEYHHWIATDGRKLSHDSPECQKMVSYHNIKGTDQHLCKVGCLLSHINLWKHIVENKINKVIIVEDDALLVNELPSPLSLPADSITYLGGFILNKKITKKDKIEITMSQGVNQLDTTKYRMMMTMAYYIPSWKIAEQWIEKIESMERWRAIDILLSNINDTIYYVSPACYIEQSFESLIRPNKRLFSNENWETECRKKI